MRVTVRGHNPLLEIDLGCVMCLRCAVQTVEAWHGSRARAAWGWLRADACEGTIRVQARCPHLGAVPLCGFENGELLLGLPPTASSPRTPKPCWKRSVARYVAAAKASEAMNEGPTR